MIQNIQQYLSVLCKSLSCAHHLEALSLTSQSLCSLGGLRTRIIEGRVLISITKVTKSKQRIRMPKSSLKETPSSAKAHRQGRCVCLLHGGVVKDEWLLLRPKACCHILVNEAASYSPVGVMGLAWFQVEDNEQGVTKMAEIVIS